MSTLNGRVADISSRTPNIKRQTRNTDSPKSSATGQRGSRGSLNASGAITGIELFEVCKHFIINEQYLFQI